MNTRARKAVISSLKTFPPLLLTHSIYPRFHGYLLEDSLHQACDWDLKMMTSPMRHHQDQYDLHHADPLFIPHQVCQVI